MEAASVAVIAALGATVLVGPLVREYADLRTTHGLGRTGALGTLALIGPAFAVGSTLAAPLSATPAAQWLVAVAATFALYSLAARAIVERVSAAETAPSRRI